MRTVLLLALLAGCADDGTPDPHEIVECNARWGGGQCERGCLAPMPEALPDGGCVIMATDGSEITIGAVEFLVVEDGVYGACVPDGDRRAYVPCE